MLCLFWGANYLYRRGLLTLKARGSYMSQNQNEHFRVFVYETATYNVLLKTDNGCTIVPNNKKHNFDDLFLPRGLFES